MSHRREGTWRRVELLECAITGKFFPSSGFGELDTRGDKLNAGQVSHLAAGQFSLSVARPGRAGLAIISVFILVTGTKYRPGNCSGICYR